MSDLLKVCNEKTWFSWNYENVQKSLILFAQDWLAASAGFSENGWKCSR
ncbi:hypothetical protein [Pseudochrobactrum sp. HB0163]